VKKGKVYIVIEPQLEEYYAFLGFRHVIKAPPVLTERMRQLAAGDEEMRLLPMLFDSIDHKQDPSLTEMPSLLVIDGGKGQLGVVVEALKEFELTIPVIGLAKREEEVFVPGQEFSLPIAKESPALFLLMRLRDEAHRFANRHREGRLRKATLRSELDVIPGVGPKTAQALFAKFGTIENVRAASDAELLEIVTASQLKAMRAAQ
jgi:excinuclease ABC subunit C